MNDAFDNAQTDKEILAKIKAEDAAFQKKVDKACEGLPSILADIKEAQLNMKAGRTLSYIKRSRD